MGNCPHWQPPLQQWLCSLLLVYTLFISSLSALSLTHISLASTHDQFYSTTLQSFLLSCLWWNCRLGTQYEKFVLKTVKFYHRIKFPNFSPIVKFGQFVRNSYSVGGFRSPTRSTPSTASVDIVTNNSCDRRGAWTIDRIPMCFHLPARYGVTPANQSMA